MPLYINKLVYNSKCLLMRIMVNIYMINFGCLFQFLMEINIAKFMPFLKSQNFEEKKRSFIIISSLPIF